MLNYDGRHSLKNVVLNLLFYLSELTNVQEKTEVAPSNFCFDLIRMW